MVFRGNRATPSRHPTHSPTSVYTCLPLPPWAGPPRNGSEVQQSLDAVRQEYPGATVKTSTFDAFIADVLPVKDQLPVIDLEVGDTWIYGTPSDPLKMAQNRALQRVWLECLEAKRPECETSNPAIANFTWALLKAPEHTWGTPGISGWGGGNDYDASKFRGALGTEAYMHAAASWAEQRFFNELAVRALEEANPRHPLADKARAVMEELVSVSAPSEEGMVSVATSATISTVNGLSLRFGPDGSISSLKHGSVEWAGSAGLFRYSYQTLNDTEWKPFTYAYIVDHSESGGFSKPGSNNYTESRIWSPRLAKLWVKGTASNATGVLAELILPEKATTTYGAPPSVYLSLQFGQNGGQGIEIEAPFLCVHTNQHWLMNPMSLTRTLTPTLTRTPVGRPP